MTKPGKVKLGDRTFDIKPPKLGQLRHLVDALDSMSGKQGGELIDAAVDLLVLGLQAADPKITVEALSDIPTTARELNQAVDIVLRTAGLRDTEAEPGEVAPQLAAN